MLDGDGEADKDDKCPKLQVLKITQVVLGQILTKMVFMTKMICVQKLLVLQVTKVVLSNC
jgi:hypothetical protein